MGDRETRGLKFAQPLGDFADFWRELKNRRQKVLLVDTPTARSSARSRNSDGRPLQAVAAGRAASPPPKTS